MKRLASVAGLMVALTLAPAALGAGAPGTSKAPSPCARADDLAGAGAAAAAKTAYIALLTKGAAPCATAGLKKLNAAKPPSLKDRASSLTGFLADLAVPLIALFFVLSVVFVALTYSTRFRRTFRGMWGFRTGLRPRLSVKSFADSGGTTDCAGVESAVRAGLSRLTRAQAKESDYSLDSITGVEGLDAQVGKLGDVAPQFKSIAAIIGFASAAARLPRYQLQGTLDDRNGSNMTVVLDDRAGLVSAATLRARPHEHTDPFGYLAVVAGAWADFRIRKIEGLDAPSTTQSAESYGHFRAGVVYQEQSRPDEAQNAYLDALERDPANLGALVNLAMIAREAGNYSTAVDLLEDAFHSLGGR